MTINIDFPGCSSINTTSSPANGNGASNEIFGFGATLSVWKAHHIADESGNFIPWCCYIPDPRLKSWGTTFRYSDVVVTNGIVTDYSLNLPENTTLNDAKATALAELPKDAKVAFFYSQNESATLEVASATLKPIMRNLNVGGTNGNVDFVFCSVANNGKFGYNASNVNSIWVKLGFGWRAAKISVC